VTDQNPEANQPPRQEPAAESTLPRRQPPTSGDPEAGSGRTSLFERPQRAGAPAGHESLPPRGQPLPQRGESRPQRSESFGGDEALPPLPGRTEPLPARGPSLPPQSSAPLPQRNDPLPQRSEPLPARGQPLPQRNDPLPQRSEPLPQRSEPLPQRSEPLPQRGGGNGLPQRGGDALAQRGGSGLPQRGGADALPQRGGLSLPRRTGRSRPGRHRSPHRLSVASDAPALIIAVPGSAAGPYVAAIEDIAATAESSCPGVEIRVGFLDGDAHGLTENLGFDAPPTGDRPLNGVLVPLLAGPHPVLDVAFGRAVDGTGGDVMLGAHLGPHPLIAEALHARLAEAGLARETRSRGLSISSSNYGVLVLADRGEESVQAAGVAAVLLASRLTLPTAHASIDDPAGIDAALSRLREAGAARPIIAPCMIGPETPQRDLDTVSNAIGAPCAAPLGAHPAIGQLVAIRYGAALTRLSMAAG
jgi:sirohydrochlorin ferrochelatase